MKAPGLGNLRCSKLDFLLSLLQSPTCLRHRCMSLAPHNQPPIISGPSWPSLALPWVDMASWRRSQANIAVVALASTCIVLRAMLITTGARPYMKLSDTFVSTRSSDVRRCVEFIWNHVIRVGEPISVTLFFLVWNYTSSSVYDQSLQRRYRFPCCSKPSDKTRLAIRRDNADASGYCTSFIFKGIHVSPPIQYARIRQQIHPCTYHLPTVPTIYNHEHIQIHHPLTF